MLFGTFKCTVDNILQKHTPMKKTYVRANQALFIYSKIHKEIKRRTRLRNKFICSKTNTDKIAYNKQRNYCFCVIQKEKKPITVILKYVTFREGKFTNKDFASRKRE